MAIGDRIRDSGTGVSSQSKPRGRRNLVKEVVQSGFDLIAGIGEVLRDALYLPDDDAYDARTRWEMGPGADFPILKRRRTRGRSSAGGRPGG